MTARYIADTDGLGLGPARPRAARQRDDRRRSSTLIAGADRRAATPTPPGGDVYFRVRSFPGYGKLSNRAARRDATRARATPSAPAQGDPLDFALWKAHKEGEDTAWDVAVGPRPAGLAHRVLGDGRGDPRRRLRHPRRRLRPGLPAPRERDRADRGRARRAARADLDAQRDGPARRARRWRSRSATSARCTRRSTRVGRDALVMYFVAGHYRQPLAFSRGARSSRPRRAVERIRDAGAAARSPGALARRSWRRYAERVLRRARRRLQHARGARGAVRLGARGEPAPRRRRDASAPGRCARCSTCSALENLLDADADDDGRTPEALELLARARAGARRHATSPRRTRLRDELRGARLGGPRRRPSGPRARARRRAVIVYGRNPVREALRGRRAACSASGRRDAAAREPWLAGGRRSRGSRRRGARAPLRLARPPGHLRRGRARTATPTPTTLLARRRRADRRARPGPGPAEPRRDLPHGRVRRAPPAS